MTVCIVGSTIECSVQCVISHCHISLLDILVKYLYISTVITRAVTIPYLNWNRDTKHRWSKDKPLCNSHRKPALRLLKRRDSTHHDDDHVWVFKVFPRSLPVNLNLRIIYNHMDAVIMCRDWDPDPPNILESDKVTFLALNYTTKNTCHQ